MLDAPFSFPPTSAFRLSLPFLALNFASLQPEDLVAFVRTFPAFGAWHRQNTQLLRPLCSLSQLEIDDLKNDSCFVAGFTNKVGVSCLFVCVSCLVCLSVCLYVWCD